MCPKEQGRDEELVVVTASQSKLEQIQKALEVKREEHRTRETNIKQWRHMVEQLQKQIKDLEAKTFEVKAL